MFSIRRALAVTVGAIALTAGSVAVLADTAGAADLNYGHCVSNGVAGSSGPFNERQFVQNDKRTGALNSYVQSNGNSHFNGAGIACGQ
jgi:hypothetical protein